MNARTPKMASKNLFLPLFIIGIACWLMTLATGCGRGAYETMEESTLYSTSGKPGTGSTMPAANGPRAMWVWNNVETKIGTSRSQFLSFVKTYGSQAGTSIYLNVDLTKLKNNDTSYQNTLTSFLSDAHAQGISVQALGGDPTWIDRPEEAVALVTLVSNLNFDGVHFDVEPHMNSSWNESSNETLLTNYLTMIDQVIAAAGTRPVYLDIAPWYFDSSSSVLVNGNPVGEAVASRNIQLVLMSYRDSVENVESFSANAITYLKSIGKSWMFGAETQSGYLSYLTFADNDYWEVNEVLNTLYQTYQMGGAIHYDDTLSALPIGHGGKSGKINTSQLSIKFDFPQEGAILSSENQDFYGSISGIPSGRRLTVKLFYYTDTEYAQGAADVITEHATWRITCFVRASGYVVAKLYDEQGKLLKTSSQVHFTVQ